MKEPWRNHPLALEGKVELVSTAWLWKYRGADVSPQADLVDGSLVDLDGLWQDIVNNGMQNPMIIRVGTKNKKFRLEAGNHRVQVLYHNNVLFAPATVQITDECGPDAPNPLTDATQSFDYTNTLPDNLSTYMKPSEMFAELRMV